MACRVSVMQYSIVQVIALENVVLFTCFASLGKSQASNASMPPAVAPGRSLSSALVLSSPLPPETVNRCDHSALRLCCVQYHQYHTPTTSM